jgi:predicted dehydrogenase
MDKVGVGYIGWFSYDDTEFSRAVAVCDLNADKVANYCKNHPEVKGYTDYHEMAKDPDVDVVIISTPNWLHCEMTEVFLAAGKHVFCEKPMGVSREEMDRMLVAQRQSGKQLSLDFEMRLSAATMRVKEIIDSGELGKMAGVEFTHHRGAWLQEGNGIWRTDPAKSGGMFFMEVCHEVDFFRFVMGEVTAVQSFKMQNVLAQYPDNMPDNVTTHFFFESGAKGLIHAHHALSVDRVDESEYPDRGHDMVFVFYGDKGVLQYDCIKGSMLINKYVTYPAGSSGVRVEFDRVEDFSDVPGAHHDVTANRLAFIKSCAEGKAHVQDAYDAWRSHCVCLAAEKSALGESERLTVDYTEPTIS